MSEPTLLEKVVGVELFVEHLRFERRAERATDYLIEQYHESAQRNGQTGTLNRVSVRDSIGALLGWLDRHQDTAEGPDDPGRDGVIE